MSDPLIQLFSEVLGVSAEKLSDVSSPDNTSQWDSLAAMHLVAAIESKYSIRLSTKEIMKMSSIGTARKVLLDKNISL
ncbi:MAG TPA: acyl carrier protein [Patescibacteria group bacterium]|jgi:acyl carrier protein|nr:acyl carrier protein [Patescibacteria group bacterium]